MTRRRPEDQIVVGVKVRKGQRQLRAVWELGTLLSEVGSKIEEEGVWGGGRRARWVWTGQGLGVR